MQLCTCMFKHRASPLVPVNVACAVRVTGLKQLFNYSGWTLTHYLWLPVMSEPRFLIVQLQWHSEYTWRLDKRGERVFCSALSSVHKYNRQRGDVRDQVNKWVTFTCEDHASWRQQRAWPSHHNRNIWESEYLGVFFWHYSQRRDIRTSIKIRGGGLQSMTKIRLGCIIVCS